MPELRPAGSAVGRLPASNISSAIRPYEKPHFAFSILRASAFIILILLMEEAEVVDARG